MDFESLYSDGFGFWLSGLIDGEGCFYISVSGGGGYLCQLSLGLRADDTPILEEIVVRTGLGRLYLDQTRTKSKDGIKRNPLTLWQVRRKEDCAKLIMLLDAFPLRTKKARDYAIWKEAALRWIAMPGRPVRGKPRDWTGFAELKDRLTNEHRYRDPRASSSERRVSL